MTLYATGAGLMNLAVADGTVVATTPLPVPVLPVQVFIGGQNADILYAGAAPQLVAGAIQINARVPTGIATGNAPVVLTVGAAMSQNGCTVAIR